MRFTSGCSRFSKLDFYIWVLNNGIIDSTHIEEFLKKSAVLRSISYFLQNIVSKDMMDLVRSIDEALINTSQLSHKAKMCNRNLDKIDSIRGVILVRVIDLLTFVLKQPEAEEFLNKDALLKIVKKLVFKPQQLGFDYRRKSRCCICRVVSSLS